MGAADPLFPLRRQALAKFGIQHDGPFPLTESVPIPAALVAAVRIQMAPRETVLVRGRARSSTPLPEAEAGGGSQGSAICAPFQSILSGDASILDPLTPEIETAIVTALRDAVRVFFPHARLCASRPLFTRPTRGRVTHTQVEGMLAGYPTSLGADMRALADPALAPGSFEQHALFLLIGEKKVLVRAFASLEKALAAASR